MCLTLGYVNTYLVINIFSPLTSHSKGKLFIIFSIQMKCQLFINTPAHMVSYKLNNRSLNVKGPWEIKEWDFYLVLWLISCALYWIFHEKWAENTFFTALKFWESKCSFSLWDKIWEQDHVDWIQAKFWIWAIPVWFCLLWIIYINWIISPKDIQRSTTYNII